MKKKAIFLIIGIMLFVMPNIAFAFVEGLKPSPSAPPAITGFVSKILGLIQWVGFGIAIGMIIYIGMKYMMSAADDKANAKQSLVNWIIGAIVIVGASTLFSVLVNFFAGTGGGTGVGTSGAAGGTPEAPAPIIGGETL